MRIKEAAAKTALTERAVRLYEEKGLISPKTVDKNGRDFRDYSEDDVRRLAMISSLRRALFTIDEIKTMLDAPDSIPAIVDANIRRMRENNEQLSFLIGKLESVDGSIDNITDAESLANAIFVPDRDIDDRGGEHGRIISREQELYAEKYKSVYDKYFSENTGWERVYEASIAAGKLLRIAAIAAAVLFVVVISAVIVSNMHTTEFLAVDFFGEDGTLTATLGGDIVRYKFKNDVFDGQLLVAGFDSTHTPRGGSEGAFNAYIAIPDNETPPSMPSKPKVYCVSGLCYIDELDESDESGRPDWLNANADFDSDSTPDSEYSSGIGSNSGSASDPNRAVKPSYMLTAYISSDFESLVIVVVQVNILGEEIGEPRVICASSVGDINAARRLADAIL